MAHKRSLSAHLSTPERPAKRRHVTFSAPRAVRLARTPPLPAAGASASTPLVTPRSSVRSSSSAGNTSYYSYAYSVPSDSPTNPLGPARAHELGLPRAISFAKHLALRVQVVGADGDPEPSPPPEPASNRRKRRTRAADAPKAAKGKTSAQRDAPFRVVQIPTNYTFRHLHALLCFLFLVPPPPPPEPPAAAPPKRRRRVPQQPPPACRPDVLPAHKFEVHRDVAMYSMAYKPGVLRSSRVCARLTEASEIWDDAPLSDADDGAQPPQEDEDSKESGEEDADIAHGGKGGARWTWENEDDFRIANVWAKGPALDRAIVYLPDPINHPSLALHITINTLPLSSRRGVGNTPHVFFARGGAPFFSLKSYAQPSSSRSSPPSTAPSGAEEGPDAPDGADDPEALIEGWNASGAFADFLARLAPPLRPSAYAADTPSPSPRGAVDDNADDGAADTDDEADADADDAADSGLDVPLASSSPVRAFAPRALASPTLSDGPDELSSPPRALSSRGRLSSPRARSLSSASAGSAASLPSFLFAEEHYERLPLVTPAPAGAQARARVDAAGRRLRGLARRGMGHLSDSEEEEGEEEKVDELAGDEEGGAGEGGVDVEAEAEEDVVL